MIIGVPKEIKDNENRVGITPDGVYELARMGHTVYVESAAGLGSGISDEDYKVAGAAILTDKSELFNLSDIILKVKEPVESEYGYFKEGQILFTYLHLAADAKQGEFLLNKKITAIAYETVESEDGTLPLLTPMSEVAGRMSIQIGASFLQKNNGGMGIILGGVPGVAPAEVVIIGGGVVGTNAAKMASYMGARVTVLDISKKRLSYLDDIFSGQITTLMSSTYNIFESVKRADLVIGAVLLPGAKAPNLVTESMVKEMKKGSVIVDVAVDQGGCIETADHATTHQNPTYEKHGVIHYSVANMPGAVPRTSTYALTGMTLPYLQKLVSGKIEDVILANKDLLKGLNTYKGYCTCPGVAQALGYELKKLEELV